MLGAHITVLLLLLIGFGLYNKGARRMIDFNKANSPVLADSISHTSKPHSPRKEGEGNNAMLFPKA